MSSVHLNSVETVNAAATAIVTAESRVQPPTIQKRRWASCWSIYSCFGSCKNSKRIGNDVLVSEPAAPAVIAPVVRAQNVSSSIVLPFIAPPSSPASFLQSNPPSATHSPADSLYLASLSVNAHSPGATAPMFTIGPYAHETQLVSPPVLSTFTTEPSTASFTPPPEPVHMTTPSSPEVPFAQLLSSSLARTRRSNGSNLRLSQYEFQPYQYPGSPGGQVKSPGSAVSTSGTLSPFPDKRPVMEFRAGEAPKFFGYEYLLHYKWGSRGESGSLTPNGWGSRLGSGTLTPNGVISALGSGTLTPNGGEPLPLDRNLLKNQVSEEASLANSNHKSDNDNDCRVSFELMGEYIPTCNVREAIPSYIIISGDTQGTASVGADVKESAKNDRVGEIPNEVHGSPPDLEGDDVQQKHHTGSLGSSKDFNFNNAKEEASEKSSVDCEWWTNEKAVKELAPQNSWSFYPKLGSGDG